LGIGVADAAGWFGVVVGTGVAGLPGSGGGADSTELAVVADAAGVFGRSSFTVRGAVAT
jgi:hypothetical protein